MKHFPYGIDINSGFSRRVVRVGMLLSRLLGVRKHSGLFFFFPYYHVGGAEKVHADIVRCFDPYRPWVFFTHQSKDKKFKPLFGREARLLDLWWLLKYALPFAVGFLAGLINRQESAVVFGCSSRFFYKMLPYLKPEVRRIDLLHAFGGGGEDFSLPAAPFLDARVVINRRTIDDFARQYAAHGVAPALLDRIVLIENRIDVPEARPVKASPRLQVLYVGRGSEEKRVHIAGAAATRARARGIEADFIFAGDVVGAIREQDRRNCTLLGEIHDPAQLAKVYRDADILLLCSSREGFPVVIMEAMANGVVPVTTSVGGIPEHVMDGVNGVLIREIADDLVTDRIVDVLSHLAQDTSALTAMSAAAHAYATEHFAGRDFCRKYRELFFGPEGVGRQ